MTAARQWVETPPFSVMVLTGPHAGESFDFKNCPVRLGRTSENDIALPKDPKISRAHVEIQFQQGHFSIHNLSEKNAVLVNDQNVRNTVIQSQCRINIGETSLQFLITDRQLSVPSAKSLKLAQIPNSNSLQTMAPDPVLATSPMSLPARSATSSAPRGNYSPSGMNYVDQENSKTLFYVILIAVISLAAFFLASSAKKRKATEIRTSDQQIKSIEDSRETLEEMKKEDERLGMNTPQYLLADQQFTKGFRDYRQGQYNRALSELGSALAFFPQHSRARRYYTMAQRKLDEQIKAHMNEGLKYKSQGNFRLCAGAYEKALRLMNSPDPNDPTLKEARQLKEECEYEKRSHD